MIVDSGRDAVWSHAIEAGIDEDIRMIAKHFDISDISIIYNGKMTFLHERPQRKHRVAVATKAEANALKMFINESKQAKKYYK